MHEGDIVRVVTAANELFARSERTGDDGRTRARRDDKRSIYGA